MKRLVEINSAEDIFEKYRGTPISDFLEYHNLERPFETYSEAKLLIGMCMDNRKHLTIPDNFAFIIRAGGANLKYSKFKVSYAIAIGNINHIALIGHTNCGMSGLASRKEIFVKGLVETAGWKEKRAIEHFEQYAPLFEIGNEIDFVIAEAGRLRKKYPKVKVAPMLYKVDDNRIYLIREDKDTIEINH
jgi:carbonic anhydrase